MSAMDRKSTKHTGGHIVGSAMFMASGSKQSPVVTKLASATKPAATKLAAAPADPATKPAAAPADPVATKLAAAAMVARHVELHEVRLSRVDAQVLTDVDEALKLGVSVDIGKHVHSFAFDETRRTLKVYIGVDVRIGPETAGRANESSRALAKVSVVFALSYQMNVAPPPAEIRDVLFSSFAEINGTYNGWPYIREQIQAITSKMGLPPIVLPVHRIPKPAANPPPSVESDAALPASKEHE